MAGSSCTSAVMSSEHFALNCTTAMRRCKIVIDKLCAVFFCYTLCTISIKFKTISLQRVMEEWPRI